MTAASATDHIRDLMVGYPDFPEPGILFRDLTPVFADAAAFRTVIDALAAESGDDTTAIAGVEARGFLLAAAIAFAAKRGVLAVRKAGKLPGVVLRETYQLEYGTATLELHANRLPPGSPVYLVDDVLATGGTLAASARLIERAGYVVVGIGVMLELEGLGGRAALGGYPLHSIVRI